MVTPREKSSIVSLLTRYQADDVRGFIANGKAKVCIAKRTLDGAQLV